MALAPRDNPPPVFPAHLFDAERAGRPWWVVRTKARQEKALARELIARRIPYYLPLVNRPKKYGSRVRIAVVPLFSGYLFFQGGLEERYQILQTGRAAQVLEVEAQEELAKELAALSVATTAQLGLQLCDFAKRGQRVRIVYGPLAGIEGIVRERKNRTKVVLNLGAIRQAAAVEIRLDMIQPI